MDENHALLQKPTVSCPKSDHQVEAARASGNMIALAEEEKAPVIAEALDRAEAKQTIITRVQAGRG